jgi:ribosome-binding protein aMBF1 (putative translation factor)
LQSAAISDRRAPVFQVRIEPNTKLPEGFRELDAVIGEVESRPGGAERMARARQRLLQRMGGEAKTLASLRLRAGLSQAQLAALLGTSQALIARYENKATQPGAQQLANLAKVLGVSADQILAAIDVSPSI